MDEYRLMKMEEFVDSDYRQERIQRNREKFAERIKMELVQRENFCGAFFSVKLKNEDDDEGEISGNNVCDRDSSAES